MCRLAFFPDEFVYNAQPSAILSFLMYLEKSQGGDGNGFYYLDNDELVKSIETPLGKLFDGYRPFLFHTRKATHGAINDFNCQPINRKRYVIVHNGIFSDNSLAPLFNLDLGEVSDSHLIDYLIEKFGFLKFFRSFSGYGVILVHNKHTKKTFLLKNTGSFEALKTKHGWCYSSDFPNTLLKTIKDKTFHSFTAEKALYEIGENGYRLIEKYESPAYRRVTRSQNYYGRTYGYGDYDWKDYFEPSKKKDKKKTKKKTKKEKSSEPSNDANNTTVKYPIIPKSGSVDTFCPKCGDLLYKDYNKNFVNLECSKCGYTEYQTYLPTKNNKTFSKGSILSLYDVMKCPKCQSHLVTTKYRDEIYYSCINCQYWCSEVLVCPDCGSSLIWSVDSGCNILSCSKCDYVWIDETNKKEDDEPAGIGALFPDYNRCPNCKGELTKIQNLSSGLTLYYCEKCDYTLEEVNN